MPSHTFRIVGLFAEDRVVDLKAVFEQAETLRDIRLVSIDFERAEAVFVFDATVAFPQATEQQVVEQFDQRLRQATRGTFGIRPQCTIARDKLEHVEIGVVGLDCRGCSYAAYLAICDLVGVEQATASFKQGLVTAWIDPMRIDREKLEEALQEKNVELATP
ncbi:MAG: hypothetical protein KDA42_15480 [Planctomycetales bacterium]|nr:hypothetical protein [Planctomycetales bacterium]